MDNQTRQDLIDYFLLGSGDSRRHLPNSPILGDVWMAYVQEPEDPAELLITSDRDATAIELAATIYEKLDRSDEDDPEIAPLQGFVAAKLKFGELLKIVVPMTQWWQETRAELGQHRQTGDGPDDAVRKKIADAVEDVRKLIKQRPNSTTSTPSQRSALDRFIALCALVYLVEAGTQPDDGHAEPDGSTATPPHVHVETPGEVVRRGPPNIEATVLGVLEAMLAVEESAHPKVFTISRNRPATTAIGKSVPTVKGDAARRLFDIDCSKIAWAVVDSGISGDHPAFMVDGKSQVKATYDFTNYRRIVSLGNERPS
jgi:serine protease AprX